MPLDTLPITAQELQKFEGLRKFLSTSKVGPSIQYSLSFTTSSNTTWNVICHFQLKQRKWQSAVLALVAASVLKHTQKNPKNLLYSLPSYGTEVKFVNLLQTIQVKELLTRSHEALC